MERKNTTTPAQVSANSQLTPNDDDQVVYSSFSEFCGHLKASGMVISKLKSVVPIFNKRQTKTELPYFRFESTVYTVYQS